MLEEKLRKPLSASLRRQAANKPQSLRVDNSDGLVVNGKVDIDDLVMGDRGLRLPRSLSSRRHRSNRSRRERSRMSALGVSEVRDERLDAALFALTSSINAG